MSRGRKGTTDKETRAIEELRREVEEDLARRADPSYRIADLVPTEGKVLGVRVPEIRAATKELRRRHPDLGVEQVASVLDRAVPEKGREEVLFWTFALASLRRQLPPDLWPRIDAWVDGIDNWETCDQLAMGVAAELAAKDPARVEDLVAWARSPNPWRRRFAVAATAAMNQKGRRHPAATLRVVEPVLADPEPTVQKAVAWALREASEQDEEAVFRFLWKHRSKCPRRVLREGAEKLTEEHRKKLLAE